MFVQSRVPLLICVLLNVLPLAAQKKLLNLRADSVIIASSCDTAELVLQNRTRGLANGVLTNKANGVTEFRKVLDKISDSLYLVGGDTLRLDPSDSAYANKNIYYVSRQFSGIAAAIIGGYTVISIVSANASYKKQLQRAKPGTPLRAYPDPYAARNAAMEDLQSGKISSAQIVVLQGNGYTVGSDDSTKNGTPDGLLPNNGTVADLQFSKPQLAADTALSSLMMNRISYYFCEGSSLRFINSAYPIYACFNNELIAFRSAIFGHGDFYQVYGEVNHFTACFFKVNNPLANTEFHAREIHLQQWQGFFLADYLNCIVVIDNLLATDANVFMFGKPDAGGIAPDFAAPAHMAHISIANCRFGKGQTPYPDSNDFWYLISLNHNNRYQGTLISINIGNLYMQCPDQAALFYIATGSTLTHVNLAVNIKNLIQRDGHYAYNKGAGGLIFCYAPGSADNNIFSYDIGSADIDASLLGMMNFSGTAGNRNNRFYIHATACRKNLSPFRGGIFKLANMLAQGPGEPLFIEVNGHFISYDTTALIYASNTWYSFPFANRFHFSGEYITAAPGTPLVHCLSDIGKILSFSDAILINDGITPMIFADSICASVDCNCCQQPRQPVTIPVYIMNVHANAAPAANILQLGDSIHVSGDLKDFFNR